MGFDLTRSLRSLRSVEFNRAPAARQSRIGLRRISLDGSRPRPPSAASTAAGMKGMEVLDG
jgi:hypothetical protein